MTGEPLSRLDWLADQVASYEKLRPQYEELEVFLEETLEAAVKQLALSAILTTRVKEIGSFAEKALRKRDQYPDPVHGFTDLCGARLIARTRSEVDTLCEWIEVHLPVLEREDVSERLDPNQFGYQSIHHIVEIPADLSAGTEAPKSTRGLRAEIQVRTTAQHAGADFAHDVEYKGSFRLPRGLEREFATIAAELEDVDSAFARLEGALRSYETSYGSYLSEERLREDLAILETVLTHERDARRAWRAGKLAIALGDWSRAVELMGGYVNPEGPDQAYQPLLRDLGVALCKLHEGRPGAEFELGQQYLDLASQPPHRDPDALSSLAGTFKKSDESKAAALYRRAYELDPCDYYALVNYLECELRSTNDTAVLAPLGPVIEGATERCRAHAEVGVNLPWALFSLGELDLLRGKPYDAVLAYAGGIAATTAGWMIEAALESIERLSPIGHKLAGYEWVRAALVIGQVARYPSPSRQEQLLPQTSGANFVILSPVVIVAGGTALQVEGAMRDYKPLFIDAFADFDGTVISGGTRSGVAGLVGEMGQHHGERVRTLGYLPRQLPAEVAADERYTELRRTRGMDFSLWEPLQYWIDILASGIAPTQVKLLAIDGGDITAIELRLALALGVSVGVVDGSGRAAARLLADAEWKDAKALLPLPADPQTLRAFVRAGEAPLPAEMRETLGRLIHHAHREGQAPPFSGWDELPEGLRESSRRQADGIGAKLERIDCEMQPVTGREIVLMSFTEEAIELLAEAEHARWNLERLGEGWRLGVERDVDRRISPHLRSWAQLPDEVKEWDRAAIRRIPQFLATVGFEIRPKSDDG